MKCNQCGFESEQSFSYCLRCGAGPQPVCVSQNGAAVSVLAALKDNLFLVICILMSASCVLSLAASNLPLITILTTIFLWLTYAQSRKDIADAKHLRCVSGTVFAQYVITYVVVGLLLVVGALCATVFTFFAYDSEIMDALLGSFMEIDGSYAAYLGAIASISGGVIMIICVFAAALVALMNIFSIRYIHRFAKSVYQSIETGVLDLKYANATQIWLFIFGAFNGIGTLISLSTDLTASLSSAAGCATCILAGLLIRKYFIPEK